MDPDAALEDARQAAADYRNANVHDDEARGLAASALVDSFKALDVWLTNGGFLPRDWRGTV